MPVYGRALIAALLSPFWSPFMFIQFILLPWFHFDLDISFAIRRGFSRRELVLWIPNFILREGQNLLSGNQQ